jgi:hypothetical protein
MEDTIKGKTRIMEFSSIAELASVAEDDHRNGHTAGRPADWAAASFAEAVKMARDGWADELASAMEIAENAVTMADQEHMTESFNQPVWDVTGAQVDVGAYLAGTPECMIDYPLSTTSRVGRVITLVSSSIISSAISADTLIRRGRVITALALALSRLGHAVEIWSDSVGVKDNKTLIQRTLIKGVNDELDPAVIMFALGHPAFHRQLVIPVRDKFTGAWGDMKSVPPSPRPADFKATYPEGSIFLPELRSSSDVPNADQFLRKYLGELGLLAE